MIQVLYKKKLAGVNYCDKVYQYYTTICSWSKVGSRAEKSWTT